MHRPEQRATVDVDGRNTGDRAGHVQALVDAPAHRAVVLLRGGRVGKLRRETDLFERLGDDLVVVPPQDVEDFLVVIGVHPRADRRVERFQDRAALGTRVGAHSLARTRGSPNRRGRSSSFMTASTVAR
jgi:hypothetical protein